jgi:glutaredoxin 3
MIAEPLRIELYGTPSCAYTAELREHLEWQGRAFVEYDVESDAVAFGRLRQLMGDNRAVPVLVENGVVKAVGWLGRSCLVSGPRADYT